MRPSRVVFTALFGGYETLLEQQAGMSDDVDFVCFTDDASVTSETWRIVPVEPLFPSDLVRSQREIKIRGHQLLDGYDEWLYIDNSVELAVTAASILDEWLVDADYAVSTHSYRERVIDEFDEVIALNYDDAGRVQEQLYHYAGLYPDVLRQRPFWNGMIARRPTETVRAAMALWFDNVLRYSRRDQLSANVAIARTGLEVHVAAIDNFASPLHRWPAEAGRKVQMGKASPAKSGPFLAEIARLERRLSDVESQNAAALADATERERALHEELGHKSNEAESLRTAMDDAIAHGDRLSTTLEDIRANRWWKATSPIRSLTSKLPRGRRGGGGR